jgi:DHA1 family bicyclomycin/chloramphenicol resistance-like MFS transporter
VATVLGWRGIFGVLGVAGAGVLALTLLSLPETNRHRAPLPSARSFFSVYGRLLRQREFRAYAIGGACLSTSIYAFLSASPFLFTELLHRPASEVGFYYMAVFAGITLGSWLTTRLTARLGIGGLLRLGATAGLAGAGLLLALDLSASLTVSGMLAAMGLFALGTGLASPAATARVIGVDPQRIGAASGLYGSLQMGFGALCTLLAGMWHGSGALPVALILLVSAAVAWLAFALVSRA